MKAIIEHGGNVIESESSLLLHFIDKGGSESYQIPVKILQTLIKENVSKYTLGKGVMFTPISSPLKSE